MTTINEAHVYLLSPGPWVRPDLTAGWRVIAERPPHPGWSRPSRPRTDRHAVNVQRTLWEAS